MSRLIDRYVLREVIPPFLVGLLLVIFVLLMNQVLLLADLFIDKGVPLPQALRTFVLLIPSILVFALPMAVLMGVLGGLARLSADSEIVAFRSLGLGERRLARPLALFGLGGFLMTLPWAMWIAPRANDAWVRTMTGSVMARIRLDIEPLEFNEALPGTVLLVREVGRDKVWHDVFAYMGEDPSKPRLVLARSGTVRVYPEKRRAILELADGRVYEGRADAPEEDTVTAFDRLEEEIDVGRLFPDLSAEKRVREKDFGELVRDLRVLEAARAAGTAGPADFRKIRSHLIEIHKKLALPAACLVFALLGLPLGIMTGRAGRAGGFSLGLVIILLYYSLLTAGEKAAMDGRLSAGLGMWGPNIILMVAGTWLALGPGRRARGRRPTRGRALRAESPPVAAPAASCPAAPPSAALRFPGLLDRYVSRKFLALFGLVLAGLVAATLLAMFFESLDDALEHHKPLGLLAGYVWFKLPEFLAFILPVAVLAAALLALGLLSRTNETTAMKASGVSAYRTVVPLLVLAAAVGGLVFLIEERVTPAAHARSEAAWNVLHDLPARRSISSGRQWILARGGERIYHFDFFDPGSSTLGRLSVFDLDARRWALVRRLFAAKAAFEASDLVYRDGWIRDFAPAAGPPFVRTASGRLGAAGDRALFEAPPTDPLRMTLGELRRYADEVQAMGFPAVRLRAEAAQKVALPFVSLVMALLAVPFGFVMGRKGALVGIGISVIIAMAYWGTFAVFRSLGATGVLSPFWGAWGANILFGLAGVVGLFRLRT